MRHNLVVLSVLFPLLSIGLSGQVTTLELIVRVPNEHQNVFFRTIPFIAVDENGVIYATDNRDKRTYRIDYNDDSTVIIGRPGQGPGDLNNPWLTCVQGGDLYIADDVGISIFKDNGEFQQRFRIFNKLISFAAKGEIVYTVESGTEKMITSYNKSGKRLSTFGTKITWDPSIYPGWPSNFIDGTINAGRLFAGNDVIYFVSFYFGELYKYDLTGKLLSKDIIADEDLVNNNREYYLKTGQARGKAGEFKTNALISDACYFQGKIYLVLGPTYAEKGRYGEIIEIDEENTKSRSRLLLSGRQFRATSFGYRGIACGVNRWNPHIFVSLYDEEREDYAICVYKRR